MALARPVAVHHGEIRRFALALRATVRALEANRVSLDAIVSELAPGLTSRPGIGPVSAAHAIVSYSMPDAAVASPGWSASARSRPPAARPGNAANC